VANWEVAGIVASRPGRFYGYAMVNPVRDAGRVYEIVGHAVQEWGFYGIEVHRHDGRISREICEAARRFSVPVLYDVMGEATVVELLATEYPQVAFIVLHLGSFSDNWGAQRTIIEQLVADPNMHTDTSGIRRFHLLAEAGWPGRARRRFSLAPTGPGCARGSNSRRSEPWDCLPARSG
jgi:predicted TIM-barrel fold metal-dependent hydrolase